MNSNLIGAITAGVVITLGGFLLVRYGAAKYSEGNLACANRYLEQQANDMAKFVNDYQQIASNYDAQMESISDPAPLAPVIASAIERVPEPSGKPPRR